ncbi:uncharacterized protein AB675_4731 [Cyphellophora attinorum]|uniref:Uncharacterized protein n=1 Tax=Cyphellophora attinorum TaxID=1664694 RepID=A0A0N1NXU1_9EURO|nr:uncharacterized protein AB675_4731 [Phialophora attinorum]KPI39044.1 hypothetical protein AB675_4731 [Phialophora attinorum]
MRRITIHRTPFDSTCTIHVRPHPKSKDGVRFVDRTQRNIPAYRHYLYDLSLADVTSVYSAIDGINIVFRITTAEYNNLCEAYVTAKNDVERANPWLRNEGKGRHIWDMVWQKLLQHGTWSTKFLCSCSCDKAAIKDVVVTWMKAYTATLSQSGTNTRTPTRQAEKQDNSGIELFKPSTTTPHAAMTGPHQALRRSKEAITTSERASKRIKVEATAEPRTEPKFAVGDKVYKTDTSGTSKTTVFEITKIREDTGLWTYTIKFDFMGGEAFMIVLESQLYTVKYPKNSQVEFEVKGTAESSSAVGTVNDWNLVDGKVHYDIVFDKNIIRYDSASSFVEVSGLGRVAADVSSVKLEKDLGNARIVTEFDVRKVTFTEDHLERTHK